MSLKIVHQGSCFHEQQVKNGESRTVHYIVKRTPFAVDVELPASSKGVTFRTGKLACQLVFDATRQPVEVFGTPSLEFVAHPSADGKTCRIDFRVLVLTTQCNGHAFRIALSLSKDKKDLAAITEPIVAVSKQQQIRNKIKETTGAKDTVLSENGKSKKRARTEDLLGTLQAILKTQQKQEQLLGRLAKRVGSESELGAPQDAEEALASALKDAVAAYEHVDEFERPRKIRRVMQSMQPSEAVALKDIGFALTTGGDDEVLTRCSGVSEQSLNSSTGLGQISPTSESRMDESSFVSNSPYPITPDGYEYHEDAWSPYAPGEDLFAL